MRTARLLFIGLSNIGDAVMTTPVLHALHALYPDAPVDLVLDRRSSALFEHCPYRGRILLKDKRLPLRGIMPLLRELRACDYGIIVDLRTGFLPLLLRGQRRFPAWRARPYGPHAVERHMGAIHALHGDRPLPETAVWLGDVDARFAESVLSGFGSGRLIALGPGANWAPKIWPARHFLHLLEGVTGRFAAAVLLGDDRDREAAAALAGGPLPCLDLCGRTTLLQAAAVLKRASVFVGNDSGLGHLASAVGTPSLTLFGPGDPVRYRPWGKRAAWVAEPHGTLADLPPEAVLDRLVAHLAQNGTATP